MYTEYCPFQLFLMSFSFHILEYMEKHFQDIPEARQFALLLIPWCWNTCKTTFF